MHRNLQQSTQLTGKISQSNNLECFIIRMENKKLSYLHSLFVLLHKLIGEFTENLQERYVRWSLAQIIGVHIHDTEQYALSANKYKKIKTMSNATMGAGMHSMPDCKKN